MTATPRRFDEPRIDLNGKTVLITGGTGSFGRGFVRRVLAGNRMRRCIGFSRDGEEEYEKGTVFSQAQLLEIKPRDIVRYMCLQAYKTADPSAEDKPIHARSTGLEVIKKAISSFMPNKNVKWNVESQTGNPTMSVAVNDLIKKIKKAEVRKQGKKSNAKRDLKVSQCSCGHCQ